MTPEEYNKPAFKTALYFLIFGFLWIVLSDNIVHNLSPSHEVEYQIQTYKGWFFILVTTALIYLVVRRQIKLVLILKNKLIKSEYRYKRIVELTQDLIWSTTPDGIITYINSASLELFGVPPREMMGRNFSEFISTEQYEKNKAIFLEKLEQGFKSVELETEITQKDGRKLFLKDTVNAVFDSLGNITSLEGASINITDHVLFEKQLIESKEALELAMIGGEIGVWEFWPETQKLLLNEYWKELLGGNINKGIISIQSMRKFIHPDDLDRVEKTFTLTDSKNKKFIESEYRILHSDGKYRWVTSKGKIAEWDKNHNPVKLMGVIVDSTEKKELELELKKQVDMYSSFISYSTEGIYLFEMNKPMPIDLPIEEQIHKLYYDGYIHTCNDAFAKMYGYEKAEDIEGMDQKTLHGSDNDPKNIEILRNFIKCGYRIINDVTIETDVDGHALHILNNVVGIIEDGMLLRTWGSQKNITEQVLVQQRVEESAKRYRLLFETNPVPLVIFDANTLRLNDVNIAMVKLLGYSKNDISKLTIQDLRPEISELNQMDLKELVEKEINKTIEIEIKSFSGKIIPCEVKFDRIEYMGVESILTAMNDLTAIKRAEVSVIQSLIEGADNERTRVAKEIHDSLGQSLTAVSLNLNSIIKEVPLMGPKAAEKFENGLKFLKTSIEESRNIAHNLMPKAIEDFGIVLTLNSLFNQLMKSTGLKINFYENLGQDIRPDINIELNLYRITQEAINNVIKHSEATEVFVQLMLHSNEIIYTFEDNGKGFDKSVNNISKKGIGLKSIYNRAIAMMGHCDIDSVPGQGTTITIIIPL